MAGPEQDKLKFDPSRTPFTTPAPRFTYLENAQAGQIMVNSDTMEVIPLPMQMYPNMPLKVPKSIAEIDQRAIRTCSYPSATNKGCDSAVNGGCPLIQRYGRGCGPFNLIMEKNGTVDSTACYAFYCGITESGRLTSQAHFQKDGWNLLMDRTTIPDPTYKVVDGKRVKEVVQREVPDLPPFYEEAKVGRFAKPQEKKRGRPRKSEVGTAA
jgi:hypothetical protein